MPTSIRALRSRNLPAFESKGQDETASIAKDSTAPTHRRCTRTLSSTSLSSSSRRSKLPSRPSFSNASFSSPISVSSCSSSSATRHDDSDESDEEHPEPRQPPFHSQTVDDSNKENIAPRRNLAGAALDQEESCLQEESIARRTRAAGPMSARSISHPSSLQRRTSMSSSTSRNSNNRAFRRTISTPLNNRKRLRGSLDMVELEAQAAAGDFDVRTPTSPLSRLRLDLTSPSSTRMNYSSNEDAESYFSSQEATSIFDCMSSTLTSQSSASRCTTPNISSHENGDEVDAKLERTTEPDTRALHTYPNVYAHAKALLRYGAGTESQVIGRDRERSSLQRFLQKRFNLFAHLEHSASPTGEDLELDGASESGSLYVCGLPGTGKTALIRSILADLEESEKTPRIAFVDCMSVQHPREIFAKVLEELGDYSVGSQGELDEVEAEERLSVIVQDPRRKTLIVLDEIDHLLRNRAHQNVLYRLFSWGASAKTVEGNKYAVGTCALIGIANSLDLTERFVPLLASKGAAPAVLNFRPFEAKEIITVVQTRFTQLFQRYDGGQVCDSLAEMEPEVSVVPLIEAVALELVAKKIAVATGDLRKALDACRLAIDIVEAEEMRKGADEVKRGGEEGGKALSLSRLTTTTAPKVKPGHILKVLSAVLGSPQLTKLRGLGLQSKLVLLALLIAQRRRTCKLGVLGVSSNSSTTTTVASTRVEEMQIRDVESTYAAMLKNDDAGAFSTVESSEFMDVVEGLEVEGVLTISNDAASQVAGTKRLKSASDTTGVSPSGKRAAKKQLLANNRMITLAMSQEDVLRGISTFSPLSATIETSKVVVEAINRIYTREGDRMERSKSWQSMAQESQTIRDEEMGGGRGAVGI
ncbi:hypothetical protein CBS101457_003696 [Exobasidium rhododendri]|nr:hypothetical protein CBS101457_003696 [Exobasidium rhododendri]